MPNVRILTEIGFAHAGRWALQDNDLVFDIGDLSQASPALYAFVIKGDIKYVGKTARTLSERLYGYRKPGPSQRTNIKVEAKIKSCLRADEAVEIYAYHDPNAVKVGRFQLNMAAALEDDIIRQLQPEWNGGERGSVAIELGSKSEKASLANTNICDQDSNRPTFLITVGKTYYRRGFFNVPVAFARYFGQHGAAIYIQVKDRPLFQGHINRTVNKSDAPRVMGGTTLRDWLQDSLAQGDAISITVLDPTTIHLATL
jgi:hypothetical protein